MLDGSSFKSSRALMDKPEQFLKLTRQSVSGLTLNAGDNWSGRRDEI